MLTSLIGQTYGWPGCRMTPRRIPVRRRMSGYTAPMKNAFVSTVSCGIALAFARLAGAQTSPVQIAGAPCVTPPALHCPDADCPSDLVINPGPVVEMKTRRTYFLDYPCDLKPDEKVTFVLSLHGAGSYGNWQRHYFPLIDVKDTYRLVVATPNSPTHVW